ncbi:dTMP kinase [Tepidimicrobium xylanilyticum]|uniref:Thymidylate kinase n=1 Tax=Tepidimicrobium xylanilyticum TaxID=1123352 RepID=A0A1H2WLC1_9FIRM|nr:dTMP kinase [Tepidimicrobium xylanilyticum]GMG95207.1 thymidylate kinase [Tepidimicrobium xylanilyticum]SDW81453.1 dTMP kinase [Tepidimicrobium xylanilyticum]
MLKGIFISLEGPDGSGKSTTIKLIADYLKERNLDFICTREPGGTQIGERIRDIILDSSNKNMAFETEALLYAASRGQHVHEKILPALKKGQIVLCERFILSSLAYQGIGRGLGIEEVRIINDFAIKGIRPDLTLFFHVDPATTLERKTLKKGGDRLEQEGTDFHRKVYQGYMELIKMYPKSVQIIDATKSIEEVFAQSIYYIEKIFERRNNI